MLIYILILGLLLYLIYHFDLKGNKAYWHSWFIVVQIILILLSGLRYRLGFDTPNYIERFYHLYPTLENFSLSDYPIGGDGPLYVLLNILVKHIGGKFFIVQLLQATFVILLIFHYIKKHTKYVFTCAFFYFLICFVQYNYEIMRGSMSIAVSLYANDYALRKKWVKAYIIYSLALLIHVQAFFLFFIPIFFPLKINFKGYAFLICVFISGYLFQLFFGDFIKLLTLTDVISAKAERYAGDDLYNTAGGNFKYYIGYIFPLLIYSLIALLYEKKYSDSYKLLMLEPLVIIGIGTLLLQMNVQILSRFVDYFKVYFVIYIAEFAVSLCKLNNKTIRYGMINCLLFFIPFIFLTCYQHRSTYMRLYPYNSVLNREVNYNRENAVENPKYGPANTNEY